jgi:hypothetical protein
MRKLISDILEILPATPTDAPQTITLPFDMNEAFYKLWTQSISSDNSQEHGGTLVWDAKSHLQLINTGGGTSGTFSPNRHVDDQEIVGIFHTHPFDNSEGGYTNISLSGGDANYMINNWDQVIIAQSGKGQFMYLRTMVTPVNVDAVKLNGKYNQHIMALIKKGTDFDLASQVAAKKIAELYGMAYYEGSEGVFQKVTYS